MNPDFQQLPREDQEQRITALLLGELTATEADAVRQALAADPGLSRLHRQLEATVALLRDAAAQPVEPAGETAAWPRMADGKRGQLLQRLRDSDANSAAHAHPPATAPTPTPTPTPRIVPVQFMHGPDEARPPRFSLALAAVFIGVLGLLGFWMALGERAGSAPAFLAAGPAAKLDRFWFDASAGRPRAPLQEEEGRTQRRLDELGELAFRAKPAAASRAERESAPADPRTVEALVGEAQVADETRYRFALPLGRTATPASPSSPPPTAPPAPMLANGLPDTGGGRQTSAAFGAEAGADSRESVRLNFDTGSRSAGTPPPPPVVVGAAIEPANSTPAAPARTGLGLAQTGNTPTTPPRPSRGGAADVLAREDFLQAIPPTLPAEPRLFADSPVPSSFGSDVGRGAGGRGVALAAGGRKDVQRVPARGRELMTSVVQDFAGANPEAPMLGDPPTVGRAFGNWARGTLEASPPNPPQPVHKGIADRAGAEVALGQQVNSFFALDTSRAAGEAEGKDVRLEKLEQLEERAAISTATASAPGSVAGGTWQFEGLARDADAPLPALASPGFAAQPVAAGKAARDKAVAEESARSNLADLVDDAATTARGDAADAGLITRLGRSVPVAGKPLTLAVEVATPQFAKQKQEAESKERELERLAAAAPATPAPGDVPQPQPEMNTLENGFSTFSLNVSDVSFKLAQASLENGQLPPPGGIRVEEFINALPYRDPEPAAGTPVGFTWERARHPFAHDREWLRLAVRTAARGRESGRPLNLVLALDNSGSMERADRVRILREALNVLASKLTPADKVSVVSFARTARLWLDGLPGERAQEMLDTVGNLAPEGGTNLEEALRVAYEAAFKNYSPGAANRVVLLTDGAANLGDVDPASLKRTVEQNRRRGVALDAFGVGWEGLNDDLLEQLTRNGDGRYGFVNTPEAATTDFANLLAGALQTAAADVKVQIEFNPRRVKAWRQVGYARHQLRQEQFRDNTVDAAELGAAESGNALYALELNPDGHGPLGTARVRFRVPETGIYEEREWVMAYDGAAPPLETSGPAMRLAATAGSFGEWLARSPYAGDASPEKLLAYVRGLPDLFQPDPRPAQFENMLRQAQAAAH